MVRPLKAEFKRESHRAGLPPPNAAPKLKKNEFLTSAPQHARWRAALFERQEKWKWKSPKLNKQHTFPDIQSGKSGLCKS